MKNVRKILGPGNTAIIIAEHEYGDMLVFRGLTNKDNDTQWSTWYTEALALAEKDADNIILQIERNVFVNHCFSRVRQP